MKRFAFIMLWLTINQVLAQVWVRRYDGPANGTDEATAIAVDASGNVYVTGFSYGGPSTLDDYATIKYNSSGDIIWLRRYNGGPDYSPEEAKAIAVDNSGNVYVTGSSVDTISCDYTTIKYNSSGQEVWVREYNGPGNDHDEADAIAVDNSGNVYVTGWSVGSGTDKDYATIKYNTSGNIVWVKRYNGSGNSGDYARAIAVDANGYIYVTGESVGSGTSSDYVTIKYNSFGDEMWVKRYNGPSNQNDCARAIAVDASGNVYVTGFSYGSGTSYDYATIKYNSFGDTVWVRRYNGPGNGIDEAWAIAVDNNGNVYVTGLSVGSNNNYGYATVKYNSSGQEVWVKRYDGPSDDEANAITVDNSGNVYVTGEAWFSGTNYDYFTIKYNSDGNIIWSARYMGEGGSGDDKAKAIAVDASGNVYVTGYSWGSGTGYDYTTIKYSPVGVEEGSELRVESLKLNVYPNPSAGYVNIIYHLPLKSNISLRIYDLFGRLVKTFNKESDEGTHTIIWDGKDDNGKKVREGIYFYYFVTENLSSTGKLAIIK